MGREGKEEGVSGQMDERKVSALRPVPHAVPALPELRERGGGRQAPGAGGAVPSVPPGGGGRAGGIKKCRRPLGKDKCPCMHQVTGWTRGAR